MKRMQTTDIICEFCKLSKQWAIVISIPQNLSANEIDSLAPFIKPHDNIQIMMSGKMFVICKSEKECYDFFSTLNYKCVIYAYVVNPDGVVEDENC